MSRLLRFIRNARTETERLARQANRLAEGLEDLGYILAEWERNPQTLIQAVGTDACTLAQALQEKFREQGRLALLAEAGVRRVDLEWRSDGNAFVRIDDHPPLELPSKLGLLLQILKADDGFSDDRFVTWKGRDQVRKGLFQETGRAVSCGSLNTLVWRLRTALQKAGLPPQLVQRHPRRGLRFALHRTARPTAFEPLPAA